MVVGSSSANRNLEEKELKLEDFLGGNSFSDQNQDASCLFSSTVSGGVLIGNEDSNTNSGNTIGLTMIKTWLRNNNEVPGQQTDEMSCDGSTSGFSGSAVAPSAATSHGLGLSMSTGVGVSREIEGSPSEAVQKGSANSGVDSQTGAIEARKAVDTFGQRTSIYRGVTRFVILASQLVIIFSEYDI
jgi:AP2-like factor, ANT lineage